jgi:hypothetical protein
MKRWVFPNVVALQLVGTTWAAASGWAMGAVMHGLLGLCVVGVWWKWDSWRTR